MVHGLGEYLIVIVGGALIWLVVHILCRYNYAKGIYDGQREEAFAWCDAIERVMVPNWQNLPVDPTKDKIQQQVLNKLYVAAFVDAKEAIGLEAAAIRIEALRLEWEKAGFSRVDGKIVRNPNV